MIRKAPIYVELDSRRELVFNLNTEILIRAGGGQGKGLLETIGTSRDEETGEEKNILGVNDENLRLYLWAALQDEARRRNETLTLEETGALIRTKKKATHAAVQTLLAVAAYYGDEPGEA